MGGGRRGHFYITRDIDVGHVMVGFFEQKSAKGIIFLLKSVKSIISNNLFKLRSGRDILQNPFNFDLLDTVTKKDSIMLHESGYFDTFR